MQAGQPRGIAASSDPPGIDAAPAAFDAAHAELLADSSIQFELKQVDPPQPPRREVQVRPPEFSPPVAASPLVQAIFWVVIALAAAGLLYLIAKRLTGWRWSRPRRVAKIEPEWRLEEAPARQLLGDADALAATGRYSEAAHLLLHRSIAEIDRRRPASIRKAFTSRDIAALPSIPPSPATAFRAIVAAVERSLFGARALNAADWQDCRAAYERFAFAEDWRG